MTKPTYTPERKAEAVALWSEVGSREASRRLGIPNGTISRWAKEAGADARFLENASANVVASSLRLEDLRKQLALKFFEAARRFVDETARPHIVFHWDKDGGWHERTLGNPTTGDKKNLITAAAIAVDKAQLLTGEATSRPDLAGVESAAARLEGLRDELAERRERKTG